MINLSRTVRLVGDIDGESAEKTLERFFALLEHDGQTPIDFVISSPGGSLAAGFGIYDMIRCEIPVKVRTVLTGSVDSTAVLVALAGDYRVMHPNAAIFLHEPIRGWKEAKFRVSDLEAAKKDLEHYGQRYVKELVARTGDNTGAIELFIRDGYTLDAETARAAGFVHEIQKPLDKS